MKKSLAAIAVICLLATAAAAQPAPTGVRGWFIKEVADLEKKMVGLAEAMPQEKYTWRPAEGIRSPGEVFIHVAVGNLRIPTAIGVKPPAGIEFKGIEKSMTEKAKIVALLKQSYEHLRTAANSVADADIEKATKLFGRDAAYRDVLLLLATHNHEHLGQSIAYARMNGVAPPWSTQ